MSKITNVENYKCRKMLQMSNVTNVENYKCRTKLQMSNGFSDLVTNVEQNVNKEKNVNNDSYFIFSYFRKIRHLSPNQKNHSTFVTNGPPNVTNVEQIWLQMSNGFSDLVTNVEWFF